MRISICLFAALMAFSFAQDIGFAQDAEPVAIGGAEPEMDRCCKYLAIISDPGSAHVCFQTDADEDGEIDGCSTDGKYLGKKVKACDGRVVKETVTVLFNSCEDRNESQCKPKSEIVTYVINSGTLTCPSDGWEDDGICQCCWERDPPVGIEIGWPIPIVIDLGGESVRITKCVGGPCPLGAND